MIFRGLIVVLLFAGLMSSASVSSAQREVLKVVATYSILGNLVENIAGGNIELTVLVSADSDSHVYEPTPQDVIALAEADLIFENGLEFETWLDDLYTTADSSAVRVVVSEGIEALPFEEDGHEDEAQASEAHAEEGEFDPHIWHDPNNGIVMVENIRDALVAADPAKAAEYETNAEAYSAELVTLDAYIRDQVASIPEANHLLVTSHDTFGYFAKAYGFDVLNVLGSVTTEAADPSAGEIAALIAEIQASGVPAIFIENIANAEVLEQVAREAGVGIAPPLYTDALGQPETPGESYLAMLRYNIDTITEALQ
jgi:ABC-type Zn uptake system ZnuABC Zn-binding protein ZnuA